MKIVATAVLAVLSVPALFAQNQTFAVDSEASEIRMKLNTTHEAVNGTFHVQSGMIDFDRTNARIAGSIVVAAGSGNTGNGSRDKKMNKEILKSGQFTTVWFAPKSYSGTIASSGDSTIQVSGIFTILGTPHDLAIPMQIHIEGANVSAKTQFTVPYVQWGLKNPSFLIWKADNDVAITLTLVGKLQ